MITITQVGKLSVNLSDGRHQVLSDISKELGGEDQGFDPHELLEGALGACTAQTLELYARRKNWDLTNLSVVVKITKEEKDSTVIETNISFGEQTPEEARKRLLEIAKKCPIHKILKGNIQLETYEK